MKGPKNLLVLSSGGDAPGMNAAMRSVVRSAIQRGMSVFGATGGYDGVIDNAIRPLHAGSVANCLQLGGTQLRTTRSRRFLQKEARKEAASVLRELSIDALVVLGGNGSFSGASLFHEESGIPVIGIPCTIDNDIVGTDDCIGFDTACNTALDAIDKIRDTALSLERGFIIEVMGRSSGFLAAHVGMAGGAEVIITPEFPLSVDGIVAQLANKKRNKLTSIIVAAEADHPGWTIDLADALNERTELNYRSCILGHIQRGGKPTAHDRVLATRMGHEAIEAIYGGQTQGMIGIMNNQIARHPFPPPNSTRKLSSSEDLDINAAVSQC